MKYQRIAMAAAVALALSGCAARYVSDKLQGYVGQPLAALTAKLGFPDQEETIAGQKVYTWGMRNLTDGTERTCRLRVIMRGDVIGSFDVNGADQICIPFVKRLWE